MQITREDINACTVKLSIVCSPEEVQEGVDKARKRIAKEIKVPGFRPGHAPKAMVDNLITPQALNEETVEQIVRKAFRSALTEQGLEPDAATCPHVDLKKFEIASSECEFEVTVPLPPKVELGKYDGLTVEQPPVDVTDQDVDDYLEEMRRRRSTRAAVVDRGVEDGDVVMVNIKVDGEEGDGRNFMAVAGRTFAELNEALRGMKVEEIKAQELTFPENFQEKDWAGKKIAVKVQVSSIQAVQLPELDDAFAQGLSTENVDDLKERVRNGIRIAKENMAREVVLEQLYEQVLQNSSVEVSDLTWQDLAARRLYDIEQGLRQEKRTLEQYAQENGMTVETLRETLESEAKKHIRRSVAMREIFVKEDLKLTDRDLNAALFEIANEVQLSPEETLEAMKREGGQSELVQRAMWIKVGDFLIEKAEVKETVGAPA